MDTYRGFNSSANHWNSMVSTFLYRERYKYDANGNITRADRNGNLTANPLMDSLYYRYVSGTNKLEYVDDYGVAVYGINTDLKDQSAGNYTYDAIGNLKTSVNRVITDIKWNVYGKIEHIQKGAIANATAQDIHYNYDPSGNRIGQFQRHRSGAPMYYNYMWYVRDAQGNVLAVYKVDSVNSASAGTLKLAEHHMYGSSRLGIINRDMDADQPKHTVETPTNLGDAYLITFNRGNKLFEISNHLGNVMLTVSDKRLPQPVGGNPSVIASYTADVVTAVDYSPFGMSLPGRIINNHWQKYRYGFNGKESDNEVNGPYNELDYGMRVYEPRLGRFLSVDPLQKQFPYFTPYQFSGNSPILCIDLDGLEPKVHINNWQHDYTWAKSNYHDDGFNNYFTLAEKDSKGRPFLVRTRTIGAYPYSTTQHQYYDYDAKDYDFFTPTGFEPDYLQNLRDLANLGKFGKVMEKGVVASSLLWNGYGRLLFQNMDVGGAIDKHGKVSTKDRVMEIHKEAKIPDRVKNSVVTIAVADVEDSKGNKFRLVSVNSATQMDSRLMDPIDKLIKNNEIRVPNILGGVAHAEENLNEFTKRYGLTIKSVDVNRPFCPTCFEQNRRNNSSTSTPKQTRPKDRPTPKEEKIKR